MRSKWEQYLEYAAGHLNTSLSTSDKEYSLYNLEIARIFVSMAHVVAIAESGNGQGA